MKVHSFCFFSLIITAPTFSWEGETGVGEVNVVDALHGEFDDALGHKNGASVGPRHQVLLRVPCMSGTRCRGIVKP